MLCNLLCLTSGHAAVQVQEALRQYNIQGVHPGLQAYLNQAVWLHMEGLLSQACKMASQRGDLSRSVPTLSSLLYDAPV